MACIFDFERSTFYFAMELPLNFCFLIKASRDLEKKATLSAASKNNNDDDDDDEEAEDMEAFINSGKLEDDDECVSDFSRK